MTERNFPLFIVEIPHQFHPKCWVADTAKEVIKVANQADQFCWKIITHEDAVECWGGDIEDLDEWPADLAVMLAESKVIEYSEGGETCYAPIDDAPSELEHAIEWITHDLHVSYIFEKGQALEIIAVGSGHPDAPTGHQSGRAFNALKSEVDFWIDLI